MDEEILGEGKLRAGEQLKELRNRLGITTREVEDYSRKIAKFQNNEKFYVSNAWLTQIENKISIPSIYKLFSLSAIYGLKFTDLLMLYGVDLEQIAKYQLTRKKFPVLLRQKIPNRISPTIRRVKQSWGTKPRFKLSKLFKERIGTGIP